MEIKGNQKLQPEQPLDLKTAYLVVLVARRQCRQQLDLQMSSSVMRLHKWWTADMRLWK